MWVFQTRESPATLAHRYENFLANTNSQINVYYMSYESFATIVAPFGNYVHGETVPYDVKTEFKGKQKLIVAVISDCTSTFRNKKIEQLLPHLDKGDFDIMGEVIIRYK